MGYYVSGYGRVEFPAAMEPQLVQILKDLNHRHELKRGGQFPKTGDPYEDSWFSWMPPRYHEDESLTKVADILSLLGFECREEKDGDDIVISLNYDSKTGAEQLFIEQLGLNGVKVNMFWQGEENEEWEVSASSGVVKSRESIKTWGSWRIYSEAEKIAEYKKILEGLTHVVQ